VLRLVGESLLNSMASGELAAAGLPYLHIRSLAVPAVLLCMVAQGACIGRQDSRTPMSIFLAAGLVNCVLDLYLVLPTGLNMGLAGAAWATLAAQYGAAVSFLIVLHRRGHLPESWHIPKARNLLKFMNVSGMLLLGSVCRMGVYTLLTVAATMSGVVTVAAHQIALQVFWFLTYFVDPLFVAATSFISRDVATRPRHASRMALLLIIMSAILGVGLGLVSFATPVFATHIFTTDAAVTAMFMKVAPFMGAGQVLASIVLVAEGVLIGVGDVAYLTRTHCINLVVLIVYLAVITQYGLGIQGIWTGIIMNQVMRLGQHAWRVASGATKLDLLTTMASVDDGGGSEGELRSTRAT